MALRNLSRCLRGLRRPRRLIAAEREFVAREFGTSLPVERLWLAGGGQPTGRLAWQPFGSLMQLDDRCFEEGDPAAPLRVLAYPTLAHEALHVWQRRHRQCAVNVSVDGLWLGATRGREAYRYDVALAEPTAMLQQFQRGNIEQQGQMFEDYVRSNIVEPDGRDARFALIARYVRGAGGC